MALILGEMVSEERKLDYLRWSKLRYPIEIRMYDVLDKEISAPKCQSLKM